MSSGMLIGIPNMDRVMIPFIPFDNNEFPHIFRKRLEQAKLINKTAKSLKECMQRDINYHRINAVIVPFIEYLKNDYLKKDYETKGLLLAGDFHLLIEKPPIIDHTDYKNNMIRLERALKRVSMNWFAPGIEQFIARLKYLMEFESPVMITDYYALWLEEFGVQDTDINFDEKEPIQ